MKLLLELAVGNGLDGLLLRPKLPQEHDSQHRKQEIPNVELKFLVFIHEPSPGGLK